MKTIYLLKGLPASGKSTWAKQYVLDNPQVKRVNKDDLRSMLDSSKWSKANEKFVLRLRDHIIEEALEAGYHIIVDDTNFHHKHELRMKELAKKHNARVEVKLFDTPYFECVERDKNRENSVGEAVILDMYDRYLNTDIDNIPLEKIWIITDTHFTHQMFIDEGIRPADYNEQIIENWNSLVGDDDFVVHLGDVIFGHEKERIKDILAGLKGRKILVKGNHDYKPDHWWREMGFESVHDYLTRDGVLFTHIPTKLPEGFRLNIHGHLHNSTHRIEEVQDVLSKKHILIALETMGYKPLKLEDILNGRI